MAKKQKQKTLNWGYGQRDKDEWVWGVLEVEWIDTADGKHVRGEGKGKNEHDL